MLLVMLVIDLFNVVDFIYYIIECFIIGFSNILVIVVIYFKILIQYFNFIVYLLKEVVLFVLVIMKFVNRLFEELNLNEVFDFFRIIGFRDF